MIYYLTNMTALIDDLRIEPVFTEREINYTVLAGGDYLFRLIPDENGFFISKMDQSLGTIADPVLIHAISEMIVQNDL